MTKLEKAIKGLECCRRGFCFFCPYNDGIDENVECKQKWADDVLSLLKAQEPKVVTQEELFTLPIDTPVFIEENNNECGWNVFCGIDEMDDVCFCGFQASADYYSLKEYNKSWRCWTSRPSEEQRAATPWDESPKEKT